MNKNGKPPMGRVLVELEVVNNADLILAEAGHLDPAEVRRQTIQGVVDSGATNLVLPLALTKELGFPVRKGRAKFRYADGRRATRAEVDEVRLFLQGRDAVFTAVAEPKRDTALIGAIVLETLDFLVDCKNLRLIPRDPDFILHEIE
jgi:predicted aspartyl protease